MTTRSPRRPLAHFALACALVGAAPAWSDETVTPEKVESILQEGMETNLVVVADTSGSMRDLPALARRGRLRRMLDRITGGDMLPAGVDRPKIDIARDALTAFVEKLPANVNCGLIFYNGCDARWVKPLGSGARERFLEAIAGMRGAGSTPLAASLRLAAEPLGQIAAKNPYARNVVLLITDGEETCESDESLQSVAASMASRFVELQVIGFDLPAAGNVLQSIGARYYFAGDSRQLEQGLSSVQAELTVGSGVADIPTGN